MVGTSMNADLETTLPRNTGYSLSGEEISSYHKNGFLKLPRFFEACEIEPLQTAISTSQKFAEQQTIRYDVENRIYKIAVWTELGNTLLGVIPRLARVVDGATIFLGQECYHWHSKIVTKEPGGGKLNWHQDYASWYQDGCLFPHMINCLIALSKSTKENGCLKIAPGSHLLGRLDIPDGCPYRDSDPQRVSPILDRLGVVYCEMEPGDVLFFHGNTLHSSDPNPSQQARSLMYCTYNAVSNEPFIQVGQEHHRYRKLHKLPDSVIKAGQYDPVLENHVFHGRETKDGQGLGVLYRHAGG